MFVKFATDILLFLPDDAVVTYRLCGSKQSESDIYVLQNFASLSFGSVSEGRKDGGGVVVTATLSDSASIAHSVYRNLPYDSLPWLPFEPAYQRPGA